MSIATFEIALQVASFLLLGAALGGVVSATTSAVRSWLAKRTLSQALEKRDYTELRQVDRSSTLSASGGGEEERLVDVVEEATRGLSETDREYVTRALRQPTERG